MSQIILYKGVSLEVKVHTGTNKNEIYLDVGRRLQYYKKVLKTLKVNQDLMLQERPPAPNPKIVNPLVLSFMVDWQEVLNLFRSI